MSPNEIFPEPGKGNTQTIVSPNGKYALSKDYSAGNDGKFYTHKVGDKTPITRLGKPHYSNTRLKLQDDGQLVIISQKAHKPEEIIWSSSTIPEVDPRFKDPSKKPVRVGVDDEGRLSLYTESGEQIWYHLGK